MALPDYAPDHLALLLVTFLLAGLVKGVIGLGLPTVGVGLLSLVMPPAQAGALILVPAFVTNIWQILAGPSIRLLMRRLWPMQLCVCLGVAAGAHWFAGFSAEAASAGLGGALLLYAAIGLSPMKLPQVPSRAEPWAGPLAGLATGVVTSLTGVFVIPAVPYLQALGLNREDLVQALGVSFTVSTVALAAALGATGHFNLQVAGDSLFALAPALLGMGAGQIIRRKVSPLLFRRFFFLGVLALGAHLALRGWVF
jgi:uncharacterized membrane protein YfcA